MILATLLLADLISTRILFLYWHSVRYNLSTSYILHYPINWAGEQNGGFGRFAWHYVQQTELSFGQEIKL
jgi:hypothetical protein